MGEYEIDAELITGEIINSTIKAVVETSYTTGNSNCFIPIS